MTVLPSALDTASPDYAAHREAMLTKLAELADEHAKALVGGGEVCGPPSRARQTPRPGADRAAPRPGHPLPGALAARRLGQRLSRRRVHGHRYRRGRGRRVRDHRERPDRTGRCLQPLDAEEGTAGQRDRVRQPPARHQPGRVRRRRSPLPEGDLHPRRGALPRSHPALGRRYPHRRGRLRQLHGGRRVCPRDVRPHRHDRGAVEGLPRRTAAREDGHGRGERRRVARRRRDARPYVGARGPLRAGRAGRGPSGAADRRPAQLAQGARRSGPGGAPSTTRRSCSGSSPAI